MLSRLCWLFHLDFVLSSQSRGVGEIPLANVVKGIDEVSALNDDDQDSPVM